MKFTPRGMTPAGITPVGDAANFLPSGVFATVAVDMVPTAL